MTSAIQKSQPIDPMIRAKRLRDRLDAYGKNRDDFPRVTLALAIELAAARGDYESNQTFGIWLATNALDDLGHTDRAALIRLGDRPREAQITLEETSSRSPRDIADEMDRRFPPQGKTAPGSTPPPKTPPAPAPTPENENLPPEKDESAGHSEQKPSRKTLTARSGLNDVARGEELAAIFLGKKPRALIGDICKGKKGKPILDLILTALDAGLLTPTDAEFKTPSLYLLFPQAPLSYARRFDLTHAKQRKELAEVILPAMIACRDKLIANPDKMLDILNAHAAEQKAAERAQEAESKRQAAVAALATGQGEIVMYGATLWPRLDNRQGEYDYDQVRAAVWTFRDLDNWNRQIANDNGVGSRGIRIRLSTKWYSEYLIRNGRDNPIRRIFTLVHHITRLMEAAPDAPCKWPPYPTAEAEW